MVITSKGFFLYSSKEYKFQRIFFYKGNIIGYIFSGLLWIESERNVMRQDVVIICDEDL